MSGHQPLLEASISNNHQKQSSNEVVLQLDEMEVLVSCNGILVQTLIKENSDIETTRQFLISEVMDHDPSNVESKYVILFHDCTTNRDLMIRTNTQYKLLWRKLLRLEQEHREIELIDKDQYVATIVHSPRQYNFMSPTRNFSYLTPTKPIPPGHTIINDMTSLSPPNYGSSQHSTRSIHSNTQESSFNQQHHVSQLPPPPPPIQSPQIKTEPLDSHPSNPPIDHQTVAHSDVVPAFVKTRSRKRQARTTTTNTTTLSNEETLEATPNTSVAIVPQQTPMEDSQEMVPSLSPTIKEPQEEIIRTVVKSRQSRRNVTNIKTEPSLQDSQELLSKRKLDENVSDDEVEVVLKKRKSHTRKAISKNPSHTTETPSSEDKQILETSTKKQKISPKIFNHQVEVFSRKHECQTIIDFIQNCYEDFDPQNNVLYIYGTNGQGKTMVTTSIFDASCLEKYQLNLAGSEKASDLIYRLYEKVYTRSSDTTKKQERITRLLEYFNKKHAPSLILLDEFSYRMHTKYLEQIRAAKVIILAITNDPPKKDPGINFLAFNQYEQDDITSILVHEYENNIPADMIQKMMGLLKNKHDMRQIKSFVETYLIPIAGTLDMSKLIKLVNTQFSRKLDILKGLGQTTIEVLVVLCCVATEKENFNGEITSDEFRRKYEEILDDDFRSNFTEIADSTEKLVQEDYITKQGISGDIVLKISPEMVLNSDNKNVKKILSNRK